MNTPLLTVNHQSPVPPYEQIGRQIRALIASGQLLPGNRLPSVRQLAGDLAVAPNTVVRAYSELEREGWVQTSARQRVQIALHPPTITADERRRKLQESVSQMLIAAHQWGFTPEETHREMDRQIASGMVQRRY